MGFWADMCKTCKFKKMQTYNASFLFLMWKFKKCRNQEFEIGDIFERVFAFSSHLSGFSFIGLSLITQNLIEIPINKSRKTPASPQPAAHYTVVAREMFLAFDSTEHSGRPASSSSTINCGENFEKAKFTMFTPAASFALPRHARPSRTIQNLALACCPLATLLLNSAALQRRLRHLAAGILLPTLHVLRRTDAGSMLQHQPQAHEQNKTQLLAAVSSLCTVMFAFVLSSPLFLMHGVAQVCHHDKNRYNSRRKHLPSLQQAQVKDALLSLKIADRRGEATHVGHHQRVGDMTLFHLPKSRITTASLERNLRGLRSETIQDMLGKPQPLQDAAGRGCARSAAILVAVLSSLLFWSEPALPS